MSFQLRQGLDADRQTIVFDIGELVYTTDTKKVFIGDGVTMGGVDIYNLHDHDDRYYTEAEINAMLSGYTTSTDFGNHVNDLNIHRTIDDAGIGVTDLWSANKINTELSLKSDNGHTHDDRYYTETEIDNIVAAIPDQYAKVSATDTTEGFLNDKIVAGEGINTAITGIGNEQLALSTSVFIRQINGVPHACYNFNGKILTTSQMNFLWTEASVANNEWIDIGTSNGANSGHIMIHDGTITNFALVVNKQNGKTSNYHVYVNGVDQGVFSSVNGTGTQSDFGALDIDFNQGDKIRIRSANGSGGSNPTDLVISLYVRWRA